MFQFNRLVGVAVLFAIAFAAAPVTALAQASGPIQWKARDGGNKYWDQVTNIPSEISSVNTNTVASCQTDGNISIVGVTGNWTTSYAQSGCWEAYSNPIVIPITCETFFPLFNDGVTINLLTDYRGVWVLRWFTLPSGDSVQSCVHDRSIENGEVFFTVDLKVNKDTLIKVSNNCSSFGYSLYPINGLVLNSNIVQCGIEYLLSPGVYRLSGNDRFIEGGGRTSLFIKAIELQTLVKNVPYDYPTIQSAINAAPTSGWTIQVAPGTYNEAIDFKGKAITVKSTGARASTIIDGTGLTTSVVRAVTGETSATVLQGFTIRNGPIGSANNTYRLGGGIFISSASPTIRDCAFTANQSAYGGGMYALYSNSLVENCTFSQNSGSADGGGVQLFGGSPIVRNCVVSDNTAGNRGGGFHVVQHNTGAAQMDGCTISGNRSNVSDGGGISMAPLAGAAQKFLVSNCTITNNSAQERGGGLWALVNPANPQQNVTLTDNTICNNTSAISKRENVWALFEDGGNTICDCFPDISGNGDVDNGDLGFVLLFMGEPTDPDFIQPDQDMNGFIDSVDIGMVLLNMGGCP